MTPDEINLALSAPFDAYDAAPQMSADDWATRVTAAPTAQVAYGYVWALAPAMRAALADLLHVDTYGMGKARACRAIVTEARA